MFLGANVIVAVNAIESTHLNPSHMDILRKPACSPSACMWRGAAMVQLHECSGSIHKVSLTGSAPILPNYLKHRYQRRLGKLNWMNCTPSLARKKRNLRPDNSRSRHSLCLELGCGVGKNLGSITSLLGARSTSQAVLQRCFSCL
jgi:hypothetical protein